MPEAWKQWEGQVVNEEFPLLRYLGGSEHSAVFLTRRADREPEEAAIKLIPGATEDPELQLSWWELAAKLSHPNLLRLFQRGRCQVDGTELLYVVTEYAEESLAQIIPHRPLTLAEALDTFQPVLDAVAYVHAKGFVHGRIKPTNILAVGDQIKLSSDGLFGMGESNRVPGAPSIYAAPEIADGAGMLPASDVWSFGMTLVEALTQTSPILKEAESAEPQLPLTLPEPFLDIASHCLRRNPQERWTVSEIAARLQHTSSAVGSQETAQSKSTFTKWGLLVPAIAVALLLAVLGPKLHHRHQEVESSPTTTTASPQPQAAHEAASDSSSPTNAPATPDESATVARVQGSVARQVSPDVSKNALRTVHGRLKVRIKVSVDSSGHVVVAKFESRGPSQYFAERALQAARKWTFKPPQVGGQGVPSEWILRFEFERSGIEDHAAQIFP